MPSVNQLAAEVKITEAWKSINIKNYPFQLEPNNPRRNDGRTKSKAASESVSRDTAKLWNAYSAVVA